MPTILPGSSVECDCNLPITYRSLHLRGSSLWSRVITKEDRQMRLGWRGVLCLMLGTGLFAIPFVYWRRFDLALPSFVSTAMIALAIAMRWKLRHHACFWLAMAPLTALNCLLIVCLPWTGKWIPALVIAPFGVLDLHAIFGLLPSSENTAKAEDLTV
jgi:hypothetical protein